MMYDIRPVKRQEYEWLLLEHHYAGRVPSVSYAFGLFDGGDIIGVCTFGCPASHHMRAGACPEAPHLVIELNRLTVLDKAPRNTESWFVSRCLKMLPPLIVISYADTKQGHLGFVYRALNFNYAGWTDMDRKTARFDYITPGRHSRASFRNGEGSNSRKERRKPKAKYWVITGGKRERKRILGMCRLPSLSWAEYPTPTEHEYRPIR